MSECVAHTQPVFHQGGQVGAPSQPGAPPRGYGPAHSGCKDVRNTLVNFHEFMEATGHVMCSYVFPFPLVIMSHVLSRVMSQEKSHVMSQDKSHVKSHSCKSHS